MLKLNLINKTNKIIMDNNVALFIDGDNISHKYCDKIIKIAKNYGNLLISRVYGDFSKGELKYWETSSVIYNIEPILVWRLGGKNSSDLRLTADAIEMINEKNNGNVNCFSERACYAEGKRISETLFFKHSI